MLMQKEPARKSQDETREKAQDDILAKEAQQATIDALGVADDSLDTAQKALQLDRISLFVAVLALLIAIAGVSGGIFEFFEGRFVNRLARLNDGLSRLESGIASLETGIFELEVGLDRVGDGIDRVDTGLSALALRTAPHISMGFPSENGELLHTVISAAPMEIIDVQLFVANQSDITIQMATGITLSQDLSLVEGSVELHTDIRHSSLSDVIVNELINIGIKQPYGKDPEFSMITFQVYAATNPYTVTDRHLEIRAVATGFDMGGNVATDTAHVAIQVNVIE
jgi:hypothetical protein